MANIDARVLRHRVQNISTLPTIPDVVKRLSVIIENPSISLNEITQFVSNDPALATKILKMVNSAIYGFPGRISSVSHAIMLIGVNVVKGLLLGISVFEVMQKAMVGLREHSVACAVAARVLATKKGMKEPEEISVAGLIHDIGKVILTLEFPDEYQCALDLAEKKEITIFEAERISFSETHANVGSWLTEKWRFPRNLVEVIANHHNPQLSKNALMETAIVHVADVLVRGQGIGFAGDPFVPAVNPAAFELLNFTEADLKEILREMREGIGQALEE